MLKFKIDELIKISIIFFILLSYFAGFNLRENLAGGAEEDFFQFTWPAIKGLEDNFLDSILNYGKFHEGSWPMFHLINAFLNPFTYSELTFQLSITFISILNISLFKRALVKKYELSFLDAYFLSSVLLLLPFFRSSAFWGLTENFGWLFLLLSINFYISIPEKNHKLSLNIIFKIFFTCLFSALALYTRQYLVFFAMFLVLNALFDKKYNHLVFYLIFFSILSIPSLILLKMWGGLVDSKNLESNWFGERHSPLNIIKNLPIFFSFYLFYLFPFLFVQEKISKTTSDMRQKFIIFIICFLSFMALYLMGYFDYLKDIRLGGGVFIKLNKFLFGENLIFFLTISSLGLTFIINLIKTTPRNIVIFITLLIFCLPQYFFQEYVEPLILIVFLFLIKDKFKFFEKKIKNYTLYFVQIYFVLNLIFTYFYRSLV